MVAAGNLRIFQELAITNKFHAEEKGAPERAPFVMPA
jgi:hypothetical protein